MANNSYDIHHVCDLYTEIPWQITPSNDNYKYVANSHNKL